MGGVKSPQAASGTTWRDTAHLHTTRIQQHQATCSVGLGSTPPTDLGHPHLDPAKNFQGTNVLGTVYLCLQYHRAHVSGSTGSLGRRRTLVRANPSWCLHSTESLCCDTGITSFCGHLRWDFNFFRNSADPQGEEVNFPPSPPETSPGVPLALGTCKDSPSILPTDPPPMPTAGAQPEKNVGVR